MTIVETNDLSNRELDILRLVATGASNKEIAQKLFISSNTVKVHLRNIFAKINATSRTEAAMYAVRIGLVENVSTRVSTQSDRLSGGIGSSTITGEPGLFSPAEAVPLTSRRKPIARSIGISILAVVLLVLGSLYIRNSVINSNPPISPTATPRIQWFQLPGLPNPRQGLATVSYDNLIYAIGGESDTQVSDIVERYDPAKNSWESRASKPTAVTEIHAALIGGVIYVPGGRLATGLRTKITEVYDPIQDQWTAGVPLPKAVSAYALAVYEGKMYIFGGWDGKQVVNSVFVFDPDENTWSESAPMPTARSSAGAVVVGGRIVIVGGWDGSQALSVSEIYHPDIIDNSKRWTEGASLPSGRYGMGVTSVADMVFVLGGEDPVADLNTIVLLQGSNEWSKLDSPVSKGWSFLNIVAIGNRLYAMGGRNAEGLVTDMWSYQAFYTITLPIIR